MLLRRISVDKFLYSLLSVISSLQENNDCDFMLIIIMINVIYIYGTFYEIWWIYVYSIKLKLLKLINDLTLSNSYFQHFVLHHSVCVNVVWYLANHSAH